MQISLDTIAEREMMPGFRGRFIHTAATTHAYWTIDAGALLPEHAHPHEQVVNMLEGRLDLVVDGTLCHLGPGDILVIPGHARHSGQALTRCRVLDVFSPVREDYRA